MSGGGHRVRVLAEWYDAEVPRAEAEALAERVRAALAARFPEMLLVVYVEPEPPADEVEGWPCPEQTRPDSQPPTACW